MIYLTVGVNKFALQRALQLPVHVMMALHCTIETFVQVDYLIGS